MTKSYQKIKLMGDPCPSALIPQHSALKQSALGTQHFGLRLPTLLTRPSLPIPLVSLKF